MPPSLVSCPLEGQQQRWLSRHLLGKAENSWGTATSLLPAVAVILLASSTGPVWLLIFVFIIIITTTILNKNGTNSFSEIFFFSFKQMFLLPQDIVREIFSLYEWVVILHGG